MSAVADLVVLAADKNMEFLLRAGFERPEALRIQPIDVRIQVHPFSDGGVRTSGATVLSHLSRQYDHAIMILDFEGSGATGSAIDLESKLDAQLARSWQDRAKAIVIEPELESWVWGSDNALKQVLRWHEETDIRKWLTENDFSFSDDGKPERPKEAFESVLRQLKRPRSSALYRRVGSSISLEKCTDTAFRRLGDQLRTWYPKT
jgi:hypothetical protein